jgi:hypothetical protein
VPQPWTTRSKWPFAVGVLAALSLATAASAAPFLAPQPSSCRPASAFCLQAALGSTFRLTSIELGARITYRMVRYNDWGYVEAASEATLPVAAPPPQDPAVDTAPAQGSPGLTPPSIASGLPVPQAPSALLVSRLRLLGSPVQGRRGRVSLVVSRATTLRVAFSRDARVKRMNVVAPRGTVSIPLGVLRTGRHSVVVEAEGVVRRVSFTVRARRQSSR